MSIGRHPQGDAALRENMNFKFSRHCINDAFCDESNQIIITGQFQTLFVIYIQNIVVRAGNDHT